MSLDNSDTEGAEPQNKRPTKKVPNIPPASERYQPGEPMNIGDDDEVEGSYSEEYDLNPSQKEIKRTTMDPLYNRSTDNKLVNKAMQNLESRLGNAGKRCIEAYHQWGRNFWRNGKEADILLGLLNAYWHQTMISVGIRLGAMKKKQARGATNLLLCPILEDMARSVARGDLERGETQFPVPPSMDEDFVKKALKIETGHYVSIFRRITGDTENRDDRAAWQKLVSEAMRAWSGKGTNKKKMQRGPDAIIQLFEMFMVDPSLVHWNNLIGASVLWKIKDEFVQNNGEWLQPNGQWKPSYQGIGNFLSREVDAMYKQFINDEIPATEDPDTWYFPGYAGLVRELMEQDGHDWLAINALEADGRIKVTELDNRVTFTNKADRTNTSVDNVQVNALPVSELDAKKQAKAAKKSEKVAKRESQKLYGKATVEQAKLGLAVDNINNYVTTQIPLILASKSREEVNKTIAKIESNPETKTIAEAYRTMKDALLTLDEGKVEEATRMLNNLKNLQPQTKAAYVSRYPHSEQGGTNEQEGCNIM